MRVYSCPSDKNPLAEAKEKGGVGWGVGVRERKKLVVATVDDGTRCSHLFAVYQTGCK